MITNDSHDGDNDNHEDEDDIHNDDDKGGVDLAAWEGSPGRLPARHTGANTLLHNAQCTQHTAKCTKQSAHCTVHNAHFTPHIAHFIWHTLRCKMRTKIVLRV